MPQPCIKATAHQAIDKGIQDAHEKLTQVSIAQAGVVRAMKTTMEKNLTVLDRPDQAASSLQENPPVPGDPTHFENLREGAHTRRVEQAVQMAGLHTTSEIARATGLTHEQVTKAISYLVARFRLRDIPMIDGLRTVDLPLTNPKNTNTPQDAHTALDKPDSEAAGTPTTTIMPNPATALLPTKPEATATEPEDQQTACDETDSKCDGDDMEPLLAQILKDLEAARQRHVEEMDRLERMQNDLQRLRAKQQSAQEALSRIRRLVQHF